MELKKRTSLLRFSFVDLRATVSNFNRVKIGCDPSANLTDGWLSPSGIVNMRNVEIKKENLVAEILFCVDPLGSIGSNHDSL